MIIYYRIEFEKYINKRIILDCIYNYIEKKCIETMHFPLSHIFIEFISPQNLQ